MKIEYDPEADAIYLEFRPLEPGTAECCVLMPDINADFGPDGRLAGIEIVDASRILGDRDKVVFEVSTAGEPANV